MAGRKSDFTLPTLDDIFSTQEQRDEAKLSKIRDIPISEIPNLMALSPQYAEYKKALDKVNDRMCRELGLHYDSNYNLVIKKDNSK